MKKFIFTLLITHCLTLGSLLIAQTPTEEWVRRWPDPSPNGSSGISIKHDSLGFIYVLADTSQGFGFLKYDSGGNLILHATYKPAGYDNSGGGWFDVTASGEVYVTGIVSIELNWWIYTVKFNSTGVFQWRRLYNPDTRDEPYDLKLDDAGNIIIVGQALVGSNSYALTLKYNSIGDTLWTRRFNNSLCRKVVLDETNNLYITGNTGPPRYYCLILKYDQLGNLNWLTTYTFDTTYDCIGISLALDNSGNIYVIGSQLIPLDLAIHSFLLKLSNTGSVLWGRLSTLRNNGGYGITGPVISTDGSSIYHTSMASNGTGGGGYSIATYRYSSTGDSLWVQMFSGGVPATANRPGNIKLDKFDNIYLCGSGYYQSTGDDFITVKYTPSGVQQWVARYTGILQNGGDGAYDLFIDTSLNVYVTGLSKKANNSTYDAVTIKYNQPIGITSNNNELPFDYKLYQNYPNPFNTATIINYEVPREGKIKIVLYNIIGKEIKILESSKLTAGYYTLALNMENLASGVYFYRMIADGSIVDTKKLVLIK